MCSSDLRLPRRSLSCRVMRPTRTEIVSAALFVGLLVLLIAVIVVTTVPATGAPALQ